MKIIPLLLRGIRRGVRITIALLSNIRLKYDLFLNQVHYQNIHSNGLPYFCVAPSGKCEIGENLTMNNGLRFNPIGFPQPCTIYVNSNAHLTIGNDVGMSQTSIICHKEIIIGNNVKIGGGSKIYDTDFHSISPQDRLNGTDVENKKCATVILEDNCFIGAGSIILKGVTIGENSVVGAGSVVTKSIPANQIWGGNPAKFIKDL